MKLSSGTCVASRVHVISRRIVYGAAGRRGAARRCRKFRQKRLGTHTSRGAAQRPLCHEVRGNARGAGRGGIPHLPSPCPPQLSTPHTHTPPLAAAGASSSSRCRATSSTAWRTSPPTRMSPSSASMTASPPPTTPASPPDTGPAPLAPPRPAPPRLPVFSKLAWAGPLVAAPLRRYIAMARYGASAPAGPRGGQARREEAHMRWQGGGGAGGRREGGLGREGLISGGRPAGPGASPPPDPCACRLMARLGPFPRLDSLTVTATQIPHPPTHSTLASLDAPLSLSVLGPHRPPPLGFHVSFSLYAALERLHKGKPCELC